MIFWFIFFFSSRRRHTRWTGDWSSDVCSSDLGLQGLDHLPTMIRALRSGKIDPAGKPRTVKEGDAFALVNGGHGPGQLAAVLAAGLAIAKARKAGVACTGVVDSADIFMIGYYAERIARAGLVGL